MSDRRFTYEEAQEIIETKKGDFKDEVLMLDTIAKALRDKRFVAGAINFDRYEVKFEIDEKGKPVSVYFKVSKDANKLVEEFMLLANRTVAERIGKVGKGKKAKVLPYRIHDLPDPEKLDNLAQFIARFGYKLRTSGTKTDVSKSINHLLDDIQGKKEENLIETVSIRAMQKARYSVHNIGHYGLAFDYYTHFTSPIRRFPDMMVHRLVTRYLSGGRTASETKYEDLCVHSSSMEQIAANAERASIKYKQVEFMSERLGQTYDGVISGVTEWGLYVELNENKCEGMIPIRDLDDDYYEFDEKNYCLRGRRKNRTYSLGDVITIKASGREKMRFVKWTSSTDGVVFADETAKETTFVMPESEVDIEAEFIEDENSDEVSSSSLNGYPNDCHCGDLTDYQTSWIANSGGVPRTHVPHSMAMEL